MARSIQSESMVEQSGKSVLSSSIFGVSMEDIMGKIVDQSLNDQHLKSMKVTSTQTIITKILYEHSSLYLN